MILGLSERNVTMEIELQKNYKEIDKQNIELFEKYGTGNCEEYRHTCVICGKKACINDSMSYHGHRLIHTNCMWQTFGRNGVHECFKWMEEEDK